MTQSNPITDGYLPAAGRDSLLPFYDAMTWFAGVGAVHRRLISGARLADGQRVLEIGCGTGNLSVAAKRAHPGVELTATDPDPLALDRARRKSSSIDFQIGYAQQLTFGDATFDRVLSALMLHHMDHRTVKTALAELFRVCKPGGSVHVVDFIAVSGAFARMGHHHHFPDVEQLTQLMTDAGFATVEAQTWRRPLVGTFVYLGATRAAGSAVARPTDSESGENC